MCKGVEPVAEARSAIVNGVVAWPRAIRVSLAVGDSFGVAELGRVMSDLSGRFVLSRRLNRFDVKDVQKLRSFST
jgi:hypothetical protein